MDFVKINRGKNLRAKQVDKPILFLYTEDILYTERKKTMKNLFSVLLCAVLVFALAACGNTDTPDTPRTPESASALALDALLAPLKAGEFSKTDILANSAFANEEEMMLSGIFGKFDYAIVGGEEGTDTATVDVKITMVDMGELFSAYLTEAMAHVTEADWDADGSYFAEMAKGEAAVTRDFTVTVQMAKDADGAWTVAKDGNDALYNALTGGLIDSLGGLEDMLS